MPHSDFLASVVKYENEANAVGKLDTRSESRKRAFDPKQQWQSRGRLIARTLYYPTRSNTQWPNFLAFVVKVNSFGSSVLH